MAKQLNVNLAVGADTSKAKAAMDDLNRTLQSIQTISKSGGLVDDMSVRRASEAARELQKHLSAAVNVDTGKLDLNRFSHSLKSSGKDLKSYHSDLMKIGPAGEQAFLKLSRSIATAETSTVRVNKKMQEFATTLKNTARWQISSSVLHGLMGAVQSAYGYAKDLDAALNDIRIVTGASAAAMDNFAVKANHAAKALSTSTTEYAKASLIYFQQGLSDSQVAERTEITIKMANAAGQSAEIISDQLTAVWNNFYDGTQTLEHYADAMVRLGADTASSSDEIAAGLEKFASIGPMIGLGFDEAAAALATVTAQTRQSADVVGTAYKTIFARIQGLNLGETLDDGTTLNKYSEALAKVGINIKDQFGGIKDMNVLLDEMGAKWNTISKDQQIALAQAVGGVRQYNQIVALMDNYDIYKENLDSAKNADGSLDVQAEIYAESWEAAEARVQAAAEGVYDSLLNEDFFIGFNNGLSVLLEGVEGLVDGLGGMTGVVATVGSLMMRHFAKEVPSALKNLRDNVTGLLGAETKDSKQLQTQNDDILDKTTTDDPTQKSRNAAIEGTKTLNAMNKQLNEGLKNLSAEERRAYEEKIKIVEAEYELLEATGKELEQEEKKTAELEKQLIKQAAKKKLMEESTEEAKTELGEKKDDESQSDYDKRVKKRSEEIYQTKRQKTEKIKGQGGRKESRSSQVEKQIAKETKELKKLITQTEKLERLQRNAKKQASVWKENAEAIKKNTDGAKGFRESISKAIDKMGGISKESKAYKELSNLLENNSDDVDALIEAFENLADSSQAFRPINTELKKLDQQVEQVENNLSDLGMDGTGLDQLEEEFRSGAQGAYDFEDSLSGIGEGAEELPQHVVKTSEAVAELGSGLMGLTGMASGIEGLFDVFSDENASAIQKISAVMGFLTTMITAATGVYKGLKAAEEAELLTKIKNTVQTKGAAIASGALAVVNKVLGTSFGATVAPITASGTALKMHPIMWILTIIMAVVAGISILCSALGKAKEKRAEEAAASKEAADATYEEVQANNELRESFESALQAYKDGTGSKEELAEATKALCEVYDIENADLLLAAENYDALAEAIRNAENEKLKAAKGQTSLAVADAEKVFEDQMRDGTGHFSGEDYIAKIGGGGSSKDEKFVQDAIDTMVASGDLNGDILSHDGNDINLNTGQSTEDLIEAYEEMQKLQQYLASNTDAAVLDESENYQNLVDWLAKSQEAYTDLIALQGQLEDVSVQAAKNTIVAKHGEIETMEEYKQAEDELTESLMADKELNLDAEEARKLAQSALASEEAYARMAKDAQIIEQASKATNNNISSEEMLDFFNSLSEDERALFATLNFESATSIENLEEQLEVLQARADRASVKTNLEAVENAQSNLKDNMSAEDYKNFESESGLSWGEDGIIEYSDFLRMTYEEQSEYLSNLNDQYTEELEASTDALISANQDRINAINEELPAIQAEVDKLAEGLMTGQSADSNLLVDAQNLNQDSATYQTDLTNLATQYGVSAEDIQSYLDAYNNATALTAEVNSLGNEISDLEEEQEINDILDFAQTKEDLLDLKKELDTLEAGDTIDAEQYKLLAEQLPHLKDAFVETADGTYQLKSGIDSLNVSWRDMAALQDENGDSYFTGEDIANMITNIGDLNAALGEKAISEAEFEARYTTLVNDMAGAAQSLAELDAAVGQFGLNTMDETYTQNLQRIAEGYDSCKTALENYQSALANFDPNDEASAKMLQAAEDQLRALISLEEAAEKYDLSADSLAAQANEIREASKDVNGEYELTAEQAAALAVANQRMNKGLSALVDGWKDWKKVLQSTDKTSQDYADTLADLSDAVQDLVGWYEDLNLDSKFVEKNMDLIEKAADGDVTAIMRLGAEVATFSVAQAQLNNTLADGKMADGTANAFQTYMSTLEGCTSAADAFVSVQEGVTAGFNNIANNLEALQNGASLQDVLGGEQGLTDWVNQLNAYAAATGMTAAEMQQMLSSVGVTANVQSDWQEQEMTVPTYREEITNLTYRTLQVTKADGSVGEEIVPEYTRASVPGPPLKTTGFVEVASISMDGEGESPGVSPPKFTGKQAPAPSAKKGSGGGGGGGGGGDSAPKKNNEKRKDPTEDKERYRVIKNQLEDLSAIYENISNAKDKAFGRARLANLQKEIKAQEDLTAANKEYLDQIESYLNIDRGDLNAAIAHTGVAATFDDNGALTNYDAILEAAVREYNQAVDEFNKHTEDDEGAKEAFEAAQERYEQVMEALDQYDETHDLWLEQQQKVLDDIMAEQALKLEETQLKVELKIEASESQLEYLEYMFDKIENKAYDCAAAFSYLNGMTEEYEKQSNAYTQGILGILENKGLGQADLDGLIKGDQGTIDKLAGMLSSGGVADLSDGLSEEEMEAAKGFTADDVDTLKEYVSGLLEANQSLMEVRQTVHDQVLEVWDEWNEKIDAGISKIEHLQSITESYQNIIDIVGQKNLGVSNEFMSKMRQQTVDQANDKLTANKAKYDSLQASFKDAKETFEAQKAKGILSPEEIKMWEDNLRQMEEDVQSAAEEFQSSWEEALEAANAAFEAAVDQIITAYDDAAAGLMGSMAELQEAFDRKSDLSSQYLEDYEKIYQISKLNREIENSIDSTDNVKAKRELLELQSKINAYEEAGVEISEYQMEQLRQEYELKKAQIELEEAQEAKSQVQMTRDADGNYSYVYTANSEDVANAEQNYEDKLHAMQQSNAEYINDLQSNMIQMEQDYQDQVQEIMKNTSLTAEERMIKLNELNQYYDEKMKFYISEAELWEENSQRLYEEDWMNYASATGYKISEEDKWLDHWDETQLSILTGFTSLEEYHSNHNMNVSNLLLSSSDAFATWQANIEEAMNNAGTSMGTFQEDATEVLDKVAEESDETKDSVVDMATDAKDAIGEVVDAVAKWEDDYSKKVQSMLAQNEALAKSFNTLLAAWSQYDDATGDDGSGDGNQGGGGDGDQGGGDNNGGGKDGGRGSGKVDNSDKAAGVAAAIWMDGGSASGWGNDPGRAKKLSEKGVTSAQAYINAHGPNGDIYADWSSKRGQLKKYYYGAFDTGGYTGEWGDDSGRFAMLHQKEIVLNEEDTSNFLKTVDIVRQIAEMIDLNAMSSAGGFNSLFAATSSNLAQTLQQEVTIHAEFPNATDRDEISAAFSDLVNLASQYAHRK